MNRTTTPAKNIGTPDFIPATPDPDLPLLDTRIHTEFARKIGSEYQRGRVFHQRRSAGQNLAHRDHFYVEFPMETFTPISASRLVRILADRPPNQSYTTADVAKILGTYTSKIQLTDLLRSSKQ